MKDIHARRPIDRVASRVTGEGVHYEPEIAIGNTHDSDLPIPTLGIPPGLDDLTGHRTGRLTVIGYHGARHNPRGEVIHHRWVLRCDCGRWTVRRSRALKKPRCAEDCCDTCSHLRSVKYKYANKVGV